VRSHSGVSDLRVFGSAWSSPPSADEKGAVKGRNLTMKATGGTEREATESVEQAKLREARKRDMGILPSLPKISPPEEMISSAVKKARRVGGSKKVKGAGAQARSRAASQLDALTKAMAVPLGSIVKGFPQLDRVHPFDRALVALTLDGESCYDTAVGKVDRLRKSILQTGKQRAAQVKNTQGKQEALDVLEEGFEELERLYRKYAEDVRYLKYISQTLRSLPTVRADVPTVVLVGAPNVGKSSIVRKLSSGRPEICNYPFTTRSITLGHIYVGPFKHQVTDTPGILWRGDESRNEMEMLTLTALDFLPGIALFVFDLTGESGTSAQNQINIWNELQGRYPERQWINVVTKKDLPREKAADGIVLPADALYISSETGEGLDSLLTRLEGHLTVLQAEFDELAEEKAKERAAEDAKMVEEQKDARSYRDAAKQGGFHIETFAPKLD